MKRAIPWDGSFFFLIYFMCSAYIKQDELLQMDKHLRKYRNQCTHQR